MPILENLEKRYVVGSIANPVFWYDNLMSLIYNGAGGQAYEQ